MEGAEMWVAIQNIVEDAMNSAIPEPWEVSSHAANRIIALVEERTETLLRALEATGEIGNLCVAYDTGRRCPYCKCGNLFADPA